MPKLFTNYQLKKFGLGFISGIPIAIIGHVSNTALIFVAAILTGLIVEILYDIYHNKILITFQD